MDKKTPREPNNEVAPGAASPTESAPRAGRPAREQKGGRAPKKTGKRKGPRKAGHKIRLDGANPTVNIIKGKKNSTRTAAVNVLVKRKWVAVGTAVLVVVIGGGGVYFAHSGGEGNSGSTSSRSDGTGANGAHASASPADDTGRTLSPSPSLSASTKASRAAVDDPTESTGRNINDPGTGSEPGLGTGSSGGSAVGPPAGEGTGSAGGSGSSTSGADEPRTTQTRSGAPAETSASPKFQVTGGSCDVSDAAAGIRKTLGNQSSGFTQGGTTYNEIVRASDGTTPISTGYDHNGTVAGGSSQWSWLCEAGDATGTYKVRVKDVASGAWSNWSILLINP
ncbi:hypothetical protein [Streptomyces sp. NPDC008150]|uniref:hypothetical protein n=1 Tax=Streptomyces sp. NPDC008150 TaxID=3364816 RepID=UPI0036EAC236